MAEKQTTSFASPVKNIVKDIGEIYSRLFDHRPAIGGEINYFLKEFEKRDDREVDKLFQILEVATDVGESQFAKMQILADVPLSNLRTNFDVALSMCQQILENEKQDEENDEFLRSRTELREEQWEKFQKDIAEKRSSVNKSFDEKEELLRKHYHNLELLHVRAS